MTLRTLIFLAHLGALAFANINMFISKEEMNRTLGIFSRNHCHKANSWLLGVKAELNYIEMGSINTYSTKFHYRVMANIDYVSLTWNAVGQVRQLPLIILPNSTSSRLITMCVWNRTTLLFFQLCEFHWKEECRLPSKVSPDSCSICHNLNISLQNSVSNTDALVTDPDSSLSVYISISTTTARRCQSNWDRKRSVHQGTVDEVWMVSWWGQGAGTICDVETSVPLSVPPCVYLLSSCRQSNRRLPKHFCEETGRAVWLNDTPHNSAAVWLSQKRRWTKINELNWNKGRKWVRRHGRPLRKRNYFRRTETEF